MPIVFPSQLDHRLGDVDPVATIKGPRQRLTQSTYSAAEVKASPVFRRQHSLRCFFQNIVDVFFAAREELRQFPFAALAGGITEDRPQRVGPSPVLPDPMLLGEILVGVHSVDLTGMSRRFRGCPWVSPGR